MSSNIRPKMPSSMKVKFNELISQYHTFYSGIHKRMYENPEAETENPGNAALCVVEKSENNAQVYRQVYDICKSLSNTNDVFFWFLRQMFDAEDAYKSNAYAVQGEAKKAEQEINDKPEEIRQLLHYMVQECGSKKDLIDIINQLPLEEVENDEPQISVDTTQVENN